ncbi:MAG: helix-turn-helix domain-containing protein [Bacteroidetes bacterium]|nr:helix-turn-helix domain-containing protein [Bacteroidota bacterium]
MKATIDIEALDILQNDVAEIKSILKSKPEELFKSTWIESKRVPELLGISAKTWQNWRDKRVIPFSQFGAKIYVKMDELNKLFEANSISNK